MAAWNGIAATPLKTTLSMLSSLYRPEATLGMLKYIPKLSLAVRDHAFF